MTLPKVKIEVEPDKVIKAEVIASYRITIPKEVRKDLNIEVGDTVIVAIIGVEKGKKIRKSLESVSFLLLRLSFMWIVA